MNTQVLMYHANSETLARWQQALRLALPGGIELVDKPGPEVRYLIAWSPPAELFTQLPGLQVCFSAGAGVDHLLANPDLPSRLAIYRLEDAGMGDQMARYCRHEVERVLLRKPTYEAQQRERAWIEHSPLEPKDLSIGLLGFGVLGKAIAQTLAKEGYPVVAYRRQTDAPSMAIIGGQRIEVFAGETNWQSFLERCQVLILVAPLTPQTRHIIDAQAMATLPAGASIINVGRGALIDADALLASLNNGHIANASLDVFATEPLPADHALWGAPGLRLTPHVSAVTMVEPAVKQISDSIAALESGQAATGAVSRSSGY
ncbi:MAG: NAD(P)-dependent oxidoreductase [Burkholderiaceae bacterium]